MKVLKKTKDRVRWEARWYESDAQWLRAHNALIVPGDFVMDRSLYLGLEARAEGRLTSALRSMSSSMEVDRL